MTDERLKPPGTLDASPVVFIDGRPADLIEVLDRGLQYGDGLFETVLIQDGRPCQWRRHLDRLYAGAQRLGIPLPATDNLGREVRALVAGLDSAVLKILVTRGRGGRGYRPPAAPEPHRLLLVYPLASGVDRFREEGIRARYCRTPASLNPALAGMKHLNRLDSVLARREWDGLEAENGTIEEGLMLDPSGFLVGGTMTNAFLWDGRALRTPPVDRAGIAGTRRALLLERAETAGIPCRVEPLGPSEIERSQGLLLTNTLVGVWPVRELDGHSYSLDGLPWTFLREFWSAARRPE